jgi:hypothetical protein
VPVALTVVSVLGLVGAAVAATSPALPTVVLAQPGHWTVDTTQKTALHVHGGIEQVDARVALPEDAAQQAMTTLQGETQGFVVGRDRAWAFDKSTLLVDPPVPLPITNEEPVGIETPGGPYLVYRGRGTIVRLGTPEAIVEAGGPLGPPVRTADGTVWVHRPDNGSLCAFRRGTVALDCGLTVEAGPTGGLTVVLDAATFVDSRENTARQVRGTTLADGTVLGTDLPIDMLLADQATSTRLPIVVPGSGVLRLLDATGIPAHRTAGAPIDVSLGPGTFSAPFVSGDIVAVLELGGSTLLTFDGQGARISELRLPPGTDASSLHRGEDGRLYIDEKGGARTHVIRADGTIASIDLGSLLSRGGDLVAGAASEAQRNPVVPPAAGAVTVPRAVPDLRAGGPGPVVDVSGPVGTGPIAPAGTAPCLDCDRGLPTPPALLAPGAPVDVRAALSGTDGATVRWSSGGGGAATSYTVTRSDGVTTTAAGRSLTSTGLVIGTSYTFTVTATNAAGTSAASILSNAVTPTGQVGAPPGLTAKRHNSGGQESIEVQWRQPDFRGGTLVHYVVEGTWENGQAVPTETTTETSSWIFVEDDSEVECIAVTVRVRAVTSPRGGEPGTDGKTGVASVPFNPGCVPKNRTLSLTPASRTVGTGETLIVSVRLDPDGEAVDAMSARLSFPAAQLACTSVSVGSGWAAGERQCGDGEVRIEANATAPRSSPSTVATVTFTGVSAGTADVDFTDASAVRSTDTDTRVRTKGGTYTVS